MKLYFGLGNPDTKYQNTRHNLGQMIINKIADGKYENFPKLKAKIFRDGDKFFAISTDYMNLSGETAQKILNYFKIDPKDLYVIHDDLDLGVGEYKIQFDRGPAGHNGVISIIENIGTQSFNRIRIGIGKPVNNIPVEDYVLQSFLPDERAIIDKVIDQLLITIY